MAGELFKPLNLMDSAEESPQQRSRRCPDGAVSAAVQTTEMEQSEGWSRLEGLLHKMETARSGDMKDMKSELKGMEQRIMKQLAKLEGKIDEE